MWRSHCNEVAIGPVHTVLHPSFLQIHSLIRRLTAVACVYGDATQRVSSYFLEGLLARASGIPASSLVANAAEGSIYKSIDCDAPLLRAFEVRADARGITAEAWRLD